MEDKDEKKSLPSKNKGQQKQESVVFLSRFQVSFRIQFFQILQGEMAVQAEKQQQSSHS